MLISGIQKFTTLDYPGKLACIVFTPGCNFRCGYCHNPEFVLPERITKIKDSFIPEEAFFEFLSRRDQLLDAVVISGGEPTMMTDLPVFIQELRAYSFLVKVDTNGSNPQVLKRLIDNQLVDYIAMDVKTSLKRYPELVGQHIDPQRICESVELIMASGIAYEFRTTLIRELHDTETLAAMADLINGAGQYYLQPFRSGHTLDPQFGAYQAFTHDEMQTIAWDVFAERVGRVVVRG